MFFQFRSAERPAWILFRTFGFTWVAVAALLFTLLLSAWLAQAVIHPLKLLLRASIRQGDGAFVSAIHPALLTRSDELGELARQLQTSGTKIESLMRQQREFLRDVSHEVRTPLARLQVAAETVELDPTDQFALNHIQREVRVIDHLVQDLLHLSRFGNLPVVAEYTTVSLNSLISGCAESARLLAERKGVVIRMTPSSDSLCTEAVEVLLIQAVDNLLANAVRYAPPGTTIELTCTCVQTQCCILVSDQGPGVPDNRLEEIFKPFVRLDTARQRETGGFGLGLALVRRIVEMHNGSVVANNREPSGLRVELWLPRGVETCISQQ